MSKLREPFFPLDGIPDPWAEAFDELTNKAILNYVEAGRLDQPRYLRLCHGIHALHWAVKLTFNPSHQLHPILTAPSKEREYYKPWGDVVAKAIQLCRIAWNSESGYANAAQWFLRVAQEGVFLDFGLHGNTKNRKRKGLELMRSQNRALREETVLTQKRGKIFHYTKRQNPFNRKAYPQTHQLFGTIILLASRSETASASLDNFIDARSKLITSMNQPGYSTWLEDDKGNTFVHLGGRGRGSILLKTDPNAKEALKTPLVRDWASRKLTEYNEPPTGLEIALKFQQQLGDPLTLALLGIIGNQTYWEGTPSQLLEAINEQVSQWPNPSRKGDTWPKTASHLSRTLNQQINQLEKIGVLVTQTHLSDRNKTRVTCLSKLGCVCLLPSSELSA